MKPSACPEFDELGSELDAHEDGNDKPGLHSAIAKATTWFTTVPEMGPIFGRLKPATQTVRAIKRTKASSVLKYVLVGTIWCS